MTKMIRSKKVSKAAVHPLSSTRAFWDYALGREREVTEIKAGVESARSVTRDQYAGFSAADRREFDNLRLRLALAPVVAGVPHLEAVHKAVAGALKRAHYSSATTQGGLIVEGEAGVGKTTTITEVASRVLLSQLTEELGDDWRGEAPERLQVERETSDGQTIVGQWVVVMTITLYGVVTPKTLLELCVKSYGSIGVPVTVFEGKVRGADLADTLSNLISNCATVLVVIDEVHFLKASGTGSETVNFLKDLTNRTNAVFLMAGVSSGRGLPFLDYGNLEAQQQLSRRFKRIKIGRLSNPIQSEDLFQVLKVLAWKTVLLDDPRSNWLTAEVVDHVYDRTQGVLQHVVALIGEAAQLAIGSEREVISPSLLDEVQLSDDAESTYRNILKDRKGGGDK